MWEPQHFQLPHLILTPEVSKLLLSQLLQICTSSKPRLPPGHVLSPHSFAAFFLGQVPRDGFGGCYLFLQHGCAEMGKIQNRKRAMGTEMKDK